MGEIWLEIIFFLKYFKIRENFSKTILKLYEKFKKKKLK